MKNKISFTAVLKDKARLKPSIGFSQTSYTSQQKYPMLSQLLQQFETDPSQQYTINLNHSYAYNQRSRNGSINMIRSRNTEQDPQNNVNFQNWIESMTHSNGNSLHKKSIGNCIKQKSIAKPVRNSHRQQQNSDYYQQPQGNMLNSKQNNSHKLNNFNERHQPINTKIQLKPVHNINQNMFNSNKKSMNQKEQKTKNSLSNEIKMQSIPTFKQTKNEKEKSNQIKIKPVMREITSQQILSQMNFKSKQHYPQIGPGQYDYLKLQFDQLKKQKLEQHLKGKKSVQRQKIEQIVSSIMKSIYHQIQSMANTIKIQNQKLRLKRSEQEEMLLDSEQNREQRKEQTKVQNSFTQQVKLAREQQYKAKINSMMYEIQQKKQKNKPNFMYQEMKTFKNYNHQEPSFRIDQVTFDPINQKNHTNLHKNHAISNFNSCAQNQTINNSNSVGYSFSNNLICQHSFNNDFSNQNFQLNHQKQSEGQKIKDQYIYKPQIQESSDQKEEKFLLPNIDEVKSENDYNGFEEKNIESSDQINYRTKKQQYNALQVDAQYIKNIQSVNYQPQQNEAQYNLPLQSSYKPPENMFKQFQTQNSFQANNNNNQSTYKYNHIQIRRRQSSSPQLQKQKQKQSLGKIELKTFQYKNQQMQIIQKNGIKVNTFSSKTFNSYLSGQKNKLQKKVQSGQQDFYVQQEKDNQKNDEFKRMQSSIRQQEPIKDVCQEQIDQNIQTKKSSQTKNSYQFNKFNSPKSFQNMNKVNIHGNTDEFTPTSHQSSQNNKIIVKKQQSPYAIAKDMLKKQDIKQNLKVTQNNFYQNTSFSKKIDQNHIQSLEVQEKKSSSFFNGSNRNDYEFYYKEDQYSNLANNYQSVNKRQQAQRKQRSEFSSLLQMKPLQFNSQQNVKNNEILSESKKVLSNDSSTFKIPQQSKKVTHIPKSLNKIQINQSVEINEPSEQNIVNTTNNQIKFSITKYQASKPTTKHISIISSHARTLSQPVENSLNFLHSNKQKSSSPKVIDINLTSQVQGLKIKPYDQRKTNNQINQGEKENIFQRLSIKESMNIDPLQEITKENFNSINKNIESLQSYKVENDKKQPLIKLSKNMNRSNEHESTYRIKKSITQSTKFQGVQTIKLSSNRNKISIGPKQSLKQSVNSSGMDFDLALD